MMFLQCNSRAGVRLPFCFLVAALLISNIAATTQAQTIWNENVNGELSDIETAPTVLSLAEGTNSVIGVTTLTDRDFFTFTVAQDTAIEALILTEYTNSFVNRAFLAVAEGTDISLDGSGHLSSMLVEAEKLGTDILDDLGSQVMSGTGFSGPLGPGTYTFWYQEVSAPTTYQFDFVVASTVPEPSSGAILLSLGIVAAIRRRRFRN